MFYEIESNNFPTHSVEFSNQTSVLVVNGFSMLHLNMRSLPKNLSLLEDLITTVKEPPEIIAISETKLKPRHLYLIPVLF